MNATKEKTKKRVVRGGRGSQADPAEVQRVIQNARESERALAKDIQRLQNDKSKILVDLADLRAQEKYAQKNELSEITQKHIAEAINHIQKQLQEINGLLPEVDHSKDQDKISKIIKDWEESRKELGDAMGKIIRGERALAKDPHDTKAAREVNTGRAEKLVAQEKMNKTGMLASIAKNSLSPSPAKNESIGNIGPLVRGEANDKKSVPEKKILDLVMEHAEKETKERSKETKNARKVKDENTATKTIGDEIEKNKDHHHNESLPSSSARERALPLLSSNPSPQKKKKFAKETGGSILEKITTYIKKNTRIRMYRARTKLSLMSAEIYKTAERSKNIDKALTMDAWWNKLPNDLRQMFALGVLASHADGLSFTSTPVVDMVNTLSAASRVLNGAELFVTIEQALKRAHEGERVDEETRLRITLDATIFAAIFGTLLPKPPGELVTGHFDTKTASMADSTAKKAPKTVFITKKGRIPLRSKDDKKPTKPEKSASSSKNELGTLKEARALQLSPDMPHTGEHTTVNIPVVTPLEKTESKGTQKQGSSPREQKIAEHVKEVIAKDMRTLFEKGLFFGLFGTPWERSPDMTDPRDGFLGKTVDEILNARPSDLPRNKHHRFGVENPVAAKKMKGYIQNILTKTGVTYEPHEKFLEYAERATTEKIRSLMNQ